MTHIHIHIGKMIVDIGVIYFGLALLWVLTISRMSK